MNSRAQFGEGVCFFHAKAEHRKRTEAFAGAKRILASFGATLRDPSRQLMAEAS
jgi:hypothetical protein